MKITKCLLKWLHDEFDRRNFTYAELARRGNTNYQNFQRLLHGKTTDITQVMEDAICEAFNITPEELLHISMNHRGSPEKQDSTIKEYPAPPYGRGLSATISPELARLFQWLENDACPDQIAAVLATARAVGCPNESTNSSHSGTASSPSAAKVA